VESCRKVENFLNRNDRKGALYNVGAYHGAMTASARTSQMKAFSSRGHERSQILVSTDRAGRGVDFDGAEVNHVIIFDFPKDPAEYVRRIGRTARAGREGVVSVMAHGWQLPIALEMVGGTVEGVDREGAEGEVKKKGRRKDKVEKTSASDLIESNKLWVEGKIEDDEEGVQRRKREVM
jgi:superfamily II DNA/RNA helicase